MKKILLTLMLCMVLISMISAQDSLGDPVELNTTAILIQTCDTCTYINITGVQLPNSTVILNGEYSMNKTGNIYTYNFVNTDIGGTYTYITCGDLDGSRYCQPVEFLVTGNGKEEPSGIVILGFSILILGIFAFIVIFIVKSIGTIIEANFDLLDVAHSWGLYFALLGSNQLANIYLGNNIIMDWLNLFVTILGFPMILVPVFAFFLSFFRAKKQTKKEKRGY
jgi:hypothetical protein